MYLSESTQQQNTMNVIKKNSFSLTHGELSVMHASCFALYSYSENFKNHFVTLYEVPIHGDYLKTRLPGAGLFCLIRL